MSKFSNPCMSASLAISLAAKYLAIDDFQMMSYIIIIYPWSGNNGELTLKIAPMQG